MPYWRAKMTSTVSHFCFIEFSCADSTVTINLYIHNEYTLCLNYGIPHSSHLSETSNHTFKLATILICSQLDYDVFNALDLMDNESVLKDLKFGPGDGNLHYYLYNWRCPSMPPKRLALILH